MPNALKPLGSTRYIKNIVSSVEAGVPCILSCKVNLGIQMYFIFTLTAIINVKNTEHNTVTTEHSVKSMPEQ